MGANSSGVGSEEISKKYAQTGCFTFLIGWVVSGLFIGFFLNSVNTTGQDMSFIVTGAVSIGFCVGCLLVGIVMLIATSKMKRLGKLELEVQKQKMQSLGALSMMRANHMAGLSLAQGAECIIYLCPDKVIFEKDANTFNLFFNKVVDVTVKTDIEIQREYGTSVGGAIAGGALFGPLGAMVWGMKDKEKRIVHKYLIYTFQNNGRVDYISFATTAINDKILAQHVEHYKSLRTEQRVVEL